MNNNQLFLNNLFEGPAQIQPLNEFATVEECKLLKSALNQVTINHYHDVYPPIGHVGITQFEAIKLGKEWYFEKAKEQAMLQKQIFNIAFNPIERLINFLQNQWPYPVKIAHEKEFSQNYFAGLIRQINNTALIHADFAPFDAPNWFIGDITHQLAWNLCFDYEGHGGTCIVHDKHWQLDDNQYRLENSYGYQPEVIKDFNKAEFTPKITDSYLFNSRNFHEVSAQTGNRLTISCFIGKKPDNSLVLWS